MAPGMGAYSSAVRKKKKLKKSLLSTELVRIFRYKIIRNIKIKVMMNQVKQLELDFGMLTAEQQDRVDRFVKSSRVNALSNSESQARIEELLIQGGFQEGIDYVNNFKLEVITGERTFGYGDEEYTTEITYTQNSGGCQLLYQVYDSYSNKIVERRSLVSRDINRLECSSITDQYRSYKPTTLYAKLKAFNNKAEYDFNAANKQKGILDYTVEKYKTLFPNAEVSVGTDYNKSRNNYTQFPIVFVKFESGSWVSFRIGYEIDKEYIHKKFDAVASQMSTVDLLRMFNNQEVK